MRPRRVIGAATCFQRSSAGIRIGFLRNRPTRTAPHDSHRKCQQVEQQPHSLYRGLAALNRGEKIGLVGPNGAGKTTLFRMITGEEQPDEGQISTEKGVTIGYFDQDVGEMSGRSAVEEVMAGAGP